MYINTKGHKFDTLKRVRVSLSLPFASNTSYF